MQNNSAAPQTKSFNIMVNMNNNVIIYGDVLKMALKWYFTANSVK